MKTWLRRSIAKSSGCMVLAATLAAIGGYGCSKRSTVSEGIPIRIGWNTTWAVEAQIIECLKHTNIPEICGLKPEFFGFSYGGPLSEAALGGRIDVLSAADQPSITLLSKGVNWSVISRCITFRDALLIPPKSKATTINDLRGKKVAAPFGSGAHRVFAEQVTKAAMKIGADIDFVNVDITEINSIIKAGGPEAEMWKGDISAAASWDPNIAIQSTAGDARILASVELVGLRTMSGDFIKTHPDAPIRFLKAVAMATLYYAQHKEQANKWFADEARIAYDYKILDIAADLDPNTRAASFDDMDMGLSTDQIDNLQGGADFALQSGMISARPDMKALTNLSYLDKALAELRANPPDLSKVVVK